MGEAPFRIDRNYRGKHLQLAFTVDDDGVFTTRWSATITYRPGLNWRGGAAEWGEYVCAENPHVYYAGKVSSVPRADKPDFRVGRGGAPSSASAGQRVM
jgi:hypothetical protein